MPRNRALEAHTNDAGQNVRYVSLDHTRGTCRCQCRNATGQMFATDWRRSYRWRSTVLCKVLLPNGRGNIWRTPYTYTRYVILWNSYSYRFWYKVENFICGPLFLTCSPLQVRSRSAPLIWREGEGWWCRCDDYFHSMLSYYSLRSGLRRVATLPRRLGPLVGTIFKSATFPTPYLDLPKLDWRRWI